MEFDLKKKIELHGGAIKKELVLSLIRILALVLAGAIILVGNLAPIILGLLLFYGFFVVLNTRRKIKKHSEYYVFAPGNPTYDSLAEYGEPDSIVNEISRQAASGKTIYSALTEANKTRPEMIITQDYYVHLNKRTTIIPLNKIVCIYDYDAQTGESPPKMQTPSRFKPIYFVIVYGEGKEAVFIHTSLDYRKILDVLDEKLNCRVKYTRELGSLYKNDYEAFLGKMTQLKEA